MCRVCSCFPNSLLDIGAYLYTISMSGGIKSKLDGLSQGQAQNNVLKLTITSVRAVSERFKAISLCK